VRVNEIITGYGILSGMKPKKSAKTSRMIRNKATILIAFIYSSELFLLRRIRPLTLSSYSCSRKKKYRKPTNISRRPKKKTIHATLLSI
jgi:hypothetical protein